MKNFFVFLILIVLVLTCVSCSITYEKPMEGIWYCEKINVSIEFYTDPLYSSEISCVKSVRIYDDEGGYRELESDWSYGRDVFIYYVDDDANRVDIYSGLYKYKEDKFTIYLQNKGDPQDNYKTQIDLNGEECVFIEIESYDKISEIESN